MGNFNFPDTPRTIIGKLVQKDDTYAQQLLWKQFFDIYHIPIKIMVQASFRSCGWHFVPEDLMEDTILDVVLGVRKAFNKAAEGNGGYDAAKAKKFRCFLKRVAHNKVVDFIRKNKNLSRNVSFESIENSAEELSELEAEAYDRAYFMDVYQKTVLPAFDPNSILAFEKRHFDGVKPAVIASELGITTKQVYNIVYNVLKKIKESIKEDAL